MSLYGVLRSGVSGMNAQSNKLGTVAENIQNSSTTGYKRASTEFSSLILPSSEGNYNSGSVTSRVRYTIGDQGPIAYTTSATDLAISGNGFFVVSDPGGANYLTRAGNFVIDGRNGNLVNAAGFTLMGYPYGVEPSLNSLDDTVPINMAEFAMQAKGSTAGTFKGNLPYDATKVAGVPVPGYTDRLAITVSNLTRGDMIQFSVGDGDIQTFDVDTETTIDALVDAFNTAVDNGELEGVRAFNVDGKLELRSETAGLEVTGSFTNITPTTKTSSLQVFDNVGNPVKIDIQLERTGDQSWAIAIYHGATKLTGPTPMTFNEFGQLDGPKSLSFNVPNGQPFELDMTGMTQLAGEYSVTGSANGNGPSAVKSAEFASDGTVYAVYEDGSRVAAYRIPLANVNSPDNLAPRAGNVYEMTSTSGGYLVKYPETGGFGSVTSGALEGSNVDIGTELTAMIEAQTSYTANSKVFQTGSELLDVLMNLKR